MSRPAGLALVPEYRVRTYGFAAEKSSGRVRALLTNRKVGTCYLGSADGQVVIVVTLVVILHVCHKYIRYEEDRLRRAYPCWFGEDVGPNREGVSRPTGVFVLWYERYARWQFCSDWAYQCHVIFLFVPSTSSVRKRSCARWWK